jgi:hypothetical protein
MRHICVTQSSSFSDPYEYLDRLAGSRLTRSSVLTALGHLTTGTSMDHQHATWRLVATTLVASLVLLLASLAPARAAGGPDLASGRPASAGSANGGFTAANVTDGDAATYWESGNGAFPQWVQVDLGSAVPVNQVVLKLPATWEARTQTLAVRTSTNGTSFGDVAPSAARSFDPAAANAATISFDQVTARYVRVEITANNRWPAGQLAGLEVYGPGTGGGDTTAPTAPGNLSHTRPAAGQIRLTWTASDDAAGVTAYDVHANGTLRASVGGTTLTYTRSSTRA